MIQTLRPAGLALLCLLPACSSVYTVSVTSDPESAMIQLDGANAGTAPTEVLLDFGSKPTYIFTGRMEGYFTEQRALNNTSREVSSGHLNLVLMEDPSWKATTISDATNNWLRVQLSEELIWSEMWQKMVDSISNRYSSLEQMDETSGYLRTIYSIRTFPKPGGTFQIRTRFVGSIADRTPLVYKMRIEAEIRSGSSNWTPYGRVFKEDAALIEEIQNRLGKK